MATTNALRVCALGASVLQSAHSSRRENSNARASGHEGVSHPGCSSWRLATQCSFAPVAHRKASRKSFARRTASVSLSVTCAVSTLADAPQVRVRGDDGKLASFPDAAAVYAVYDEANVLQYVGISRRVSASIRTHAEDLPDLCHSVKVAIVEKADKEVLVQSWREWLQEVMNTGGDVPPGNVSGNDTWTKRKQRAAKPEIKLTPGPHVKLNVPMEQLIDKLVKGCNVIAFIKGSRTAPECGFSHRVLTILNEEGVDYETVNVLDEVHNPGLREAIKTYSQWPTIPQVYIKGEFIGGADILQGLVESGEIKKALAKA